MRPAALWSSAARSISGFPVQRDLHPAPTQRGFDELSSRHWFLSHRSRETRSSREICSWCPRGEEEREFFRGKKLFAPDATAPRNPCRWNTASPAAQTPLRLHAECRCSPLPTPGDG